MAIRTVNTGRQAEGLPPLKKPRVHLSRETVESSNDPVESSIPGDDDLYTDCYWSSEVPNDEILVMNKSTNTIVWSRLTEGMKVEDLGIDIFTDPVGDVRKRLQRLMNLAEDEVLKMLKSGFGDVRAPRLWYDKAARDLCQIGFARHPLDRCVFMSFNGGGLPKSVSEGMERLDGILGLHVDDFIGGGEGMSRVAVEGWNHVPVGVPNSASRVKKG